MMAAKARISAAILLVCIILPLLASAFLDHLPEVLEHDSRNKDVTIRGDNSIVRANDNDFTLPRSHDKKNERSLREKKHKKKKKNKKGKKSHKDKTFDFDHLFGGNQQEGDEFSPYLQPFDVPQTTEEQEPAENYDGLREGFYQKTCPQTENIIRNGLIRAFQNDSTIAAAFPRLLLHDCFVNGCDGSILLDTTPSGARVEKLAGTNGATVKGFELIDEIKAELERQCPGIVSCSDILVYLSRDAFVLSGLPNYNVLAGRRDGMESNEANVVGNLPLPGDTVDQMIDLFQKKGLNSEDLVVLIGAHSIGVAHCFNFLYRLDEPEKAQMLDPRLAGVMRFMCANQMNTLPFDPTTQYKMDSIFYKQLMMKKGLIESDQILAQDIRTRGFVQKFGDDEMGWFDKFGKAMNKLGAIEVLTGNQGQIRRQCRAVN
ncbi:peroxidase 57-like [Nicotiana tabacum]|uniref:Lignin-forming anionic peroxidase n=1 Tax=Nicotiana tabacum TaxID=4097 RepID=A0A1S4DHJ1_TOBAC|nr:PREDICTED: peroxidase 57-like [Nicotiana tabacum]